MSVIIAVKKDGHVYMGADSQTSAGSNKINGLTETSFKIVKLDNGILLGFCGKVAAKQYLLGKKDIFTLDENGNLNVKHIVNNIIPELIEDLPSIGDEGSNYMNISIIMAYKDCLFKIDDDFCVYSVTDYVASGCGSEYVDYSMYIHKDKPVQERILKSLIASAKKSTGVSGPYVFMDTKEKEYKIIDAGEENW